jgi:tetrahydromethanopterin S-methyltransferase subunit G
MPLNKRMNDDGRNQSAASAQRLQAHEVSLEEYNDLAKRLDTMEASVGFVLNKVKMKNS